jgi:hypothetical protein
MKKFAALLTGIALAGSGCSFGGVELASSSNNVDVAVMANNMVVDAMRTAENGDLVVSGTYDAGPDAVVDAVVAVFGSEFDKVDRVSDGAAISLVGSTSGVDRVTFEHRTAGSAAVAGWEVRIHDPAFDRMITVDGVRLTRNGTNDASAGSTTSTGSVPATTAASTIVPSTTEAARDDSQLAIDAGLLRDSLLVTDQGRNNDGHLEYQGTYMGDSALVNDAMQGLIAVYFPVSERSNVSGADFVWGGYWRTRSKAVLDFHHVNASGTVPERWVLTVADPAWEPLVTGVGSLPPIRTGPTDAEADAAVAYLEANWIIENNFESTSGHFITGTFQGDQAAFADAMEVLLGRLTDAVERTMINNDDQTISMDAHDGGEDLMVGAVGNDGTWRIIVKDPSFLSVFGVES